MPTGGRPANANSLQLVAKATFAAGYKIVAIGLDTPSILGTYVVRCGSGAGNAAAAAVWTGMVMVDWRTLAGPEVQIPVLEPAWQPADPLVDAPLVEATSGNAGQDDTVYVSGIIATGLGT